jgi:hypothetical protein
LRNFELRIHFKGMMQSGLSRELFESWCTDKKSGVIIAGYCGNLDRFTHNIAHLI